MTVALLFAMQLRAGEGDREKEGEQDSANASWFI